jgi:hypothetical protein
MGSAYICASRRENLTRIGKVKKLPLWEHILNLKERLSDGKNTDFFAP